MKIRLAPISGAMLVAIAIAGGGCSVTPVALTEADRAKIAAQVKEQLFADQEPLTGPLTLAEATARALKYQQEYRVRIMEEAAALGQLDAAKFDMLPKLTVNAGYSTRSNEAFGFGFSPSGTVAANPSASSERQHTTENISFAWSILDFGLSYYRARQLADQKLITEERRRKAQQNLVQDVRLTWWRAEAAQRLLPQVDALFDEIDETVEKTRVIEERKLLPPLQTAALRRALLDLQQQIALRRQELAQSQIELATLINVSPGANLRLATPVDASAARYELKGSIDALESIALNNRPELAEETYKARVSEIEARRAMIPLLPNLSVDGARNYDSNRYLVNNTWYSAGLSVAFNLAKAFSIPATRRSAEAQRLVDETRRLAVAMAVMSQTRIAAVRHELVREEFEVWDEAVKDDDSMVKYLSASSQVGIDTELELIRAKARAMVSRINRDLTYATLEAALGRIYNSIGLAVLPEQMPGHTAAEIAKDLKERIGGWEAANFAPKRTVTDPVVRIGEMTGVPEDAAKDVRTALSSIFELSRVKVAVDGDATYRMGAVVTLEPLREGGRPVQVKAQLTDAKTGTQVFSTEFKTTLSEPVDADQWKTIGEAVAYRLTAPLRKQKFGTAGRSAGPVPTVAGTSHDNPSVPVQPDGDFDWLRRETPLVLRMDPEFPDPRAVAELLSAAGNTENAP